MKMPHTRIAMMFAALMALTIAAGACSSDPEGDDPGTTAPDEPSGIAPEATAINIAEFTFEPTTLSVPSGSTEITITNADSADHTFTLDDDSVDQAVAAGETVSVTVDVSGSVGFHCEIHPDMTGTLEVA